MDAMVIREADARDIPKIMSIMKKAFDPANGEAWTAAQCISALALPGTFALVAEANPRTLGFALSRHVLDEAELLLIAVRPDAQLRGIGGLLMAAIVDKLATAGVKTLHLEMRENNPAIDFYRRRQFLTVGRRRNYYRREDGTLADAITLSRNL